MGAQFFLSRLCFIAGAAESKNSPTSFAMMRMLGAHLSTTTATIVPSTTSQPTTTTTTSKLNFYNNQETTFNQLTVGQGPHCPHCGKIYSNASNLRQHVRNVHVPIDKSLWHTCPTCGKKLKTKHYLINHQLQAHGIHQRGAIQMNIGKNY